MDSFYYAVMLLGIAWICAWAALDKPDPGFGWWPFDMVEDAPPAERAAMERAGAGSTSGRRGVSPRAARPAGAAPSPVQAAATGVAATSAGRARAALSSWRARAAAVPAAGNGDTGAPQGADGTPRPAGRARHTGHGAGRRRG